MFNPKFIIFNTKFIIFNANLAIGLVVVVYLKKAK